MLKPLLHKQHGRLRRIYIHWNRMRVSSKIRKMIEAKGGEVVRRGSDAMEYADRQNWVFLG